MKRNVIIVPALAWILSGCTLALIGAAQQSMKSDEPAVATDQRLADLGRSALSGGSYGLAEAYLAEALKANPDNPYALHDLGVVYYNTNRTNAALAINARLVAMDSAAVDFDHGRAARRTPTELVSR